MTAQTVVIKIGGSTLGHGDTSLADMVALHARGTRVIVVHGGGAEISRWLSRLGLESQFVDGLRVTGPEELRVVAAVLAGLVNKMLVAQLVENGGKAVGVSGADGELARAAVTNPALGHVGEITVVDPHLLNTLLAGDFIPVVSPVCLGTVSGHEVLLNVNADDVAAEVAVAVGASSLVYLTDVPGILDSTGQVIAHVAAQEIEPLINGGVIRGGMIPKARACMRASRGVPRTRIIDGTATHALLREDDPDPGGTTIVTEELD
ncbi:MAG: acetylglutamate kinase [Dehalococcoidia bacterium]|nr:MAG: acetylglutamate kinase [Dehalococcoidia bacterium]